MWPNPQETADLVTFIEEKLNEKLNFILCSDKSDKCDCSICTTYRLVYLQLRPSILSYLRILFGIIYSSINVTGMKFLDLLISV